MTQRPYEKLIAWQEAHKLCLWIYSLTKSFPMDERFRLVNQLCKAASSVPTNITEGNGKSSVKGRKHFWEIAACSLDEVHYHCRLALDLKYITPEHFLVTDDRIQRTGYLLYQLRKSLVRKPPRCP